MIEGSKVPLNIAMSLISLQSRPDFQDICKPCLDLGYHIAVWDIAMYLMNNGNPDAAKEISVQFGGKKVGNS